MIHVARSKECGCDAHVFVAASRECFVVSSRTLPPKSRGNAHNNKNAKKELTPLPCQFYSFILRFNSRSSVSKLLKEQREKLKKRASCEGVSFALMNRFLKSETRLDCQKEETRLYLTLSCCETRYASPSPALLDCSRLL